MGCDYTGCWVLYIRRIESDGWVKRGNEFTLHMEGTLNYANIERCIAENREQFPVGSYLVTCGDGYHYVFHVVEQTTTRIEVGR